MFERIFDKIRVATRIIAVCIGPPHRLDHDPRCRRAVKTKRLQIIAVQDIQYLAKRDAARLGGGTETTS